MHFQVLPRLLFPLPSWCFLNVLLTIIAWCFFSSSLAQPQHGFPAVDFSEMLPIKILTLLNLSALWTQCTRLFLKSCLLSFSTTLSSPSFPFPSLITWRILLIPAPPSPLHRLWGYHRALSSVPFSSHSTTHLWGSPCTSRDLTMSFVQIHPSSPKRPPSVHTKMLACLSDNS